MFSVDQMHSGVASYDRYIWLLVPYIHWRSQSGPLDSVGKCIVVIQHSPNPPRTHADCCWKKDRAAGMPPAGVANCTRSVANSDGRSQGTVQGISSSQFRNVPGWRQHSSSSPSPSSSSPLPCPPPSQLGCCAISAACGVAYNSHLECWHWPAVPHIIVK